MKNAVGAQAHRHGLGHRHFVAIGGGVPCALREACTFALATRTSMRVATATRIERGMFR
jgi:hypothetical protein